MSNTQVTFKGATSRKLSLRQAAKLLARLRRAGCVDAVIVLSV